MLTKSDELKDRIEAKRAEMVARLKELKADTRHEAIAARDKVSAGLTELEQTLKDGWDKVSSTVEEKLNTWLNRHSN